MEPLFELVRECRRFFGRKQHHLALPEPGVLVEDLAEIVRVLARARQVSTVARIGCVRWPHNVDLNLRIAAKPWLLHVQNPRELEVKPRRNGRRNAATAAVTRLSACNEAGSLGCHRLERSDRGTA